MLDTQQLLSKVLTLVSPKTCKREIIAVFLRILQSTTVSFCKDLSFFVNSEGLLWSYQPALFTREIDVHPYHCIHGLLIKMTCMYVAYRLTLFYHDN